jgi:5-methylcytosine-specific restriction endonuclease McrA
MARSSRRMSDTEKWHVLDRDKGTCVYCGWSRGRSYGRADSIHVDHVVPWSRGGVATRENLVCSCGSCNLFKGARTPEEAGLEMRFLQKRVDYICSSMFEIRLEGDTDGQ